MNLDVGYVSRKAARPRKASVIGAVSLLAAAGLLLAACSPSPSGGGGSKGGKTISVATTNPATSFNAGTPEGNLDTNGMIEYLTGAGRGLGTFFTLDPEFNVVPDEGVGAIEKLSDSPLTVKYTLKKGLKWSDGEPITADDMLMSWVIESGWFDDATMDEETGKPKTGTKYFSLAGSTDGLDLTDFPEIGDDNLSMTLKYSEPFVDWPYVNPLNKPAHILAKQVDMNVEQLRKLFTDTPKGDPASPQAKPIPELQKISAFWNTAYDATSMPDNPDLLVGAGPFIVTAFVTNQSMTFSKNPEYTGKHKIAYDELVFRFIGDTNAQIKALENGEVNAIFPQPSADTNAALEQIGAKLYPGDQMAYDHLDLNFGSATFSDAKVREAFLKTIPRKQILDAIVTPLNPKAEVLNSQIWVNANPEYPETVKVNGYEAFGEPDIEGAKALLAGATPTVRILYNNENPNRVDTYQLIKASAEQAGFVVEDKGDPNWSNLLSGGDYEASIFGWVAPGVGNDALAQVFKTGGGGNYSKYSNAEVDALVDRAQTTLDAAALEKIKIQIDTLTAKDFYGLPLFQLPGLFADNGTIEGMEFFGGQTGIVWNAQEWKLK